MVKVCWCLVKVILEDVPRKLSTLYDFFKLADEGTIMSLISCRLQLVYNNDTV